MLGASPRTQCYEETATWKGRILESTAKWMAGAQGRRECWWSQGWTEWDAEQAGGGERRGTEPISAVELVSTLLLLWAVFQHSIKNIKMDSTWRSQVVILNFMPLLICLNLSVYLSTFWMGMLTDKQHQISGWQMCIGSYQLPIENKWQCLSALGATSQ